MTHRPCLPLVLGLPLALAATGSAQQNGSAEPASVPGSMPAYVESVAGTEIEIPMVPIPAGEEGYPTSFRMGSPAGEDGRQADEGPQFEVVVGPFWIGKFEVTWDTFNVFLREYPRLSERSLRKDAVSGAEWADAVSVPTPLYEQDTAPILSGMGTGGGYPVANITQLAARQFTKWLTKKTGHYYRLPTEAEWEFAARAGTTTAFSFGDDPEQLGDYAVYFDNSEYDDFAKGHPDFGAGYRKVGSKKPNPWGVHDMHGNVAEWVIDQYTADGYARITGERVPFMDAIAWPEAVFPCVARGGSWDAEPLDCRSATRMKSDSKWQDRDPQFPKSVWWFTDGFHVGFRVVRPLREPADEVKLRFWESADEGTIDIVTAGGKEVRVKIDGEDQR